MPKPTRSMIPSLLLALVTACDGGDPDDTDSASSDSSSVATSGETGDTPTTDQDGSTTGDDGASGSPDPSSATGEVCSVPPVDPGPPASIHVVEDLAWASGESGFEGLPAWDGEYPECAVSPTCDGNTAPVLTAPLLFLNGAYSDLATPISAGDRVGIVFPFADAECNLVGGSMVTDTVGPVYYSGGSGEIYEMACSSGPGLGFDLGLPDPGVTTYALDLTDRCGGSVHYDGKIVVSP